MIKFIIIIIIIIIITPFGFFTPALADGFSLESEWQQVSSLSRTLLSILANLNNAVVWIARSPIFNSFGPFTKLFSVLWKVPSTCLSFVFWDFLFVVRWDSKVLY